MPPDITRSFAWTMDVSWPRQFQGIDFSKARIAVQKFEEQEAERNRHPVWEFPRHTLPRLRGPPEPACRGAGRRFLRQNHGKSMTGGAVRKSKGYRSMKSSKLRRRRRKRTGRRKLERSVLPGVDVPRKSFGLRWITL